MNSPSPARSGHHLAADRITQLAAGAEPPNSVEQAHLGGCLRCREAVAADRAIVLAARTVDARQHGPLRVPPPARLLADPRLKAARLQRGGDRIAPVRSSQRATWQLSAELLFAQARFFSSWGAAAVLLWTAVAGAAGWAVQDKAAAARLTAAAISLLLLVAALWATEPKRDSRLELLQSLPISPRLVYLFRLTGAMSIALALGLLVSVLGLVQHEQLHPLISLWLGPGLLAASSSALIGVRWNVMAGQSVGLLTWLLGSAVRVPGTAEAGQAASLAHSQLASSPVALLLVLVFFLLAIQATPGRKGFLPYT